MRHYFIFRPARNPEKRLRRWIGGALLLVTWALFELRAPPVLAAPPLPAVEQTGARDFVEYWSAGRLFAQGGNPYSPAALLALQRTIGWTGSQPLVMWNPPWTLPIVLPFGLSSFAAGQFLWLLFHVCLIMFSAHQLWRIYGNSLHGSGLARFLAFTFVPTAFVLIIGQITPLVLAALTLFLYYERKQDWRGMSASLVLLTIKPHLLYLFWIVVPLWLIEKRLWRLISTVALMSAGAVIMPLLFDSSIYSKYFALYGAAGILKPLDWPVPTLRNVIRIFLDLDSRVLQFAPTVVASAWVIHYWYHRRQVWRWREQLPLLSIVSVTSSVFVWTYDQVVLIPAIIEAAVWMSQAPAPWHRFWTTRLYIAINACHVLQRFWLAEELWYFWLAPALLTNYLIFRWERKATGE